MWQLFENWLAVSTRQWLIVLDNVDDADLLFAAPSVTDETRALKQRINYIPSCKHGNVIITSRDKTQARRLLDESSLIEVRPMTSDHARTLLQNKLGAKYDEDNATRLAEALDYMPLALSQAASFIHQKRRYTIEKYLAELEKGRQSRTSLLLQEATVPKRDRDASSSIILTWEISFTHIHSIRKSAADLLALMSFCDRQAIPDMLLRGPEQQRCEVVLSASNSEEDDSEYDEDTLDGDLQMLEDYSFISTASDLTTWDMHRLVQDATQRWLSISQKYNEACEKYIEQLHAVVPPGEYENWKICRILTPHVRSAASLTISPRKTSPLWATVMYRMAWYELGKGSLTHAEEFVKASLCTRKGLLGEDDADTLCSQSIMSEILRKQGRWKQAEELGVEVLETRKIVLGLEHPDTLTSINILATIYSNQGRWKEAEELQVEVLETTKTVLRAEHPSMLIIMANLALIYWNQGRWREAEELQLEVLKARKIVLGAEHPGTLTSIANLAAVYKHQGRWKEAEELEVEVLETTKIVLGVEHPDTLTSTANLASTYSNQGRWKEAEELEVEVLEMRKIVLGAEHPNTLSSMANLASTHRKQRRWKEAEELEVEVLEIRKAVLGVEHPGTLTSMINLVATYYGQQRLQEAIKLAQECAQSRVRVLGLAHPDTRMSMEWLEVLKEHVSAVDSDEP